MLLNKRGRYVLNISRSVSLFAGSIDSLYKDGTFPYWIPALIWHPETKQGQQRQLRIANRGMWNGKTDAQTKNRQRDHWGVEEQSGRDVEMILDER